jgi:hypothetical protein
MSELAPAHRNRWYCVKWPGERQLTTAWAEKYFPAGHVYRPVQSHEKPAAWPVCVDLV